MESLSIGGAILMVVVLAAFGFGAAFLVHSAMKPRMDAWQADLDRRQAELDERWIALQERRRRNGWAPDPDIDARVAEVHRRRAQASKRRDEL